MQTKYISPFINATIETMETMLGVSTERLSPFIKDGDSATGDISGIIGFTGERISGSISLCFPFQAALKSYELMVAEKVSRVTEEVQDSVGELINIVAGYAKKDFDAIDVTFNISLPFVIVGQNHSVTRKTGTPTIVMPFSSSEGVHFTLEISIIETK